MSVVLLLLILTHGYIVFSDFKSRSIYLLLFPVLLILSVAKGLLLLNNLEYIINIAVNLLMVATGYLSLLFVYYLRFKKINLYLKDYIGKGDVWLIVILCGCFSPLIFILFMVTVALIGLCGNLLFRFKHIPFAGYLSLIYLLLTIATFKKPDLLFNDLFLLQLL